MYARHFGRNTSKWPARRPPGLGIPGFKLARATTKPEQNDVLLGLPRTLGKNGIREESTEASHRRRRRGQALEEQATMKPMLIGRA